MASRNLELGIQSIRNGQPDEGARLIRIALREDMTNDVRAAAYLWLAETTSDNNTKLDFYRQAQQYDPANAEIGKRISALLTAQLPPTPSAPSTPSHPLTSPNMSSTGSFPAISYDNTIQPQRTTTQQMPTVNMGTGLGDLFNGQPPLDLTTFQHVVGVSGGPNGVGAGFFINQQGVIATSRYVVGMNTQMDILLNTGQSLRGMVVRSFPAYDLAFLRVNAWARQLSPFATTPLLMDNTPLVIVDHRGQGTRTSKRATRQETAPHWFPTMTNIITDAGGNPVFDDRGVLVGMMTMNAFRTNNLLYGLHISAIASLLDNYLMEARQANNAATYCPSCGAASRAALFGGFYCETCGNTLPQFASSQRFPQLNPNVAILYGENNQPCPKCGARVGYYKNRCLRCEDISQ
jgi:hypothetical protein